MKVVVSSATAGEWTNIKEQLDPLYTNSPGFEVVFHRSGVGLLASVFSLTKMAMEIKPDFIIQAGIAGSFSSVIPLNSIVVVNDELQGDTGVEENGTFKDIFDMRLENSNEFPFSNKRLVNPWLITCNYLGLPGVSGVTVNEITTRSERINHLRHQCKADIETMEGAALHYVCLYTGIPFVQLRAISNYVGERDKSKWSLNPALENLKVTVLEYVGSLYKKGQFAIIIN